MDNSSIPKTASLNLHQIIALYIGSVLGSGILLVPGLTADLAGPASLIAWLIMSLLSIPMALTMGLLSVKMPHSGGVSHFVTMAFNPGLGSLAGWFFLFSTMIGVPIMGITGAMYASTAFGLDARCVLPLTMLIILTALFSNYFGMKLTGQIQTAVVISTVGLLVAAVFSSLHSIEPTNFTPFMPAGFESVGMAATLIFWCFLGWEAVSHITSEFENPQRDVFKGTIIASVIISLLYLATAYVVIGTHCYGSGVSEVSLIHLIAISTGKTGMYIAGFIALFITTAPAIAYVSAASRLAFTLSKTGYAPTFLSRLSCRYNTPVGGLVFISIAILVTILIFQTGLISLSTLILIPNATFILTYFAGCAAGVVLLKDNPIGLFVSVVSLILTGIAFCFVGNACIWPIIIVILWAIYLKRIHR